MHTMGSRLTQLTLLQGFCAETGGAIVGVGAARRPSAVRWAIAGHILIAWIVTIPAAAAIAALAYWLVGAFS